MKSNNGIKSRTKYVKKSDYFIYLQIVGRYINIEVDGLIIREKVRKKV